MHKLYNTVTLQNNGFWMDFWFFLFCFHTVHNLSLHHDAQQQNGICINKDEPGIWESYNTCDETSVHCKII